MQTAMARTERRPKRDRAAYMRAYRRRKSAEAATRREGAALRRVAAKRYSADSAGVFAWCEDTLKIPSGPNIGKPLRLAPFQREFIAAVVNKQYKEVGLSIARKNAKSVTASVIVLAYLAGPLNRHRWRGLLVSVTGILAGEILRQVGQLAASAPELAAAIQTRSSPTRSITGLREARLDLLASNKAAGVATNGSLCLFDELGLVRAKDRHLVEQTWSAMGAERDSTFVAVSIRGPGGVEYPFMDELYERSKAGTRTWWREYAATPGAALGDVEELKKANPGIEHGIKDLRHCLDSAARAQATPAAESDHRLQEYNQQVAESVNALVPLGAWLKCESWDDKTPVVPRGRLVAGVDLGGASSACAFVAVEVEGDGDNPSAVFARAAFGGGDLLARGARDHVGGLYQQLYQEGEIKSYRDPIPPVKEFLHECLAELSALNGGDYVVEYIGLDRFRAAESRPIVKGIARKGPIYRGQGASSRADGSHDVRASQAAILGRSIVSPHSRLIQSGLAVSTLALDESGNPKLRKAHAQGRIDVISALVIALGIRALMQAKPRRRSRISVVDVPA